MDAAAPAVRRMKSLRFIFGFLAGHCRGLLHYP
jgi:hypothetical protein